MDEIAVDTLSPDNMARWLRETAANTRAVAQLPWSDQQRRVAPHVAFRLEQAADLIERLAAPPVWYWPCEKHLASSWTMRVTYTPTPKAVCPICNPPDSTGDTNG